MLGTLWKHKAVRNKQLCSLLCSKQSFRCFTTSSSSNSPPSMRPLKGMRDLYPSDQLHFQAIESLLTQLCKRWGYESIQLPILEPMALFDRSLGQTSEVIGNKQNYSFVDQGGKEVVLRPEGTSGALRAYLHARKQRLSSFRGENRVIYTGPMFRRENPQKGRHREFYQFGCEFIGGRKETALEMDLEILTLAHECISKAVALSEDDVRWEVNDVGTSAQRAKYANVLHEYLLPHVDDLGKQSQHRVTQGGVGVLRVLDSKDPLDQQFLLQHQQDVPLLMDFIGEEARNRFKHLCERLKLANVNVSHNPMLIRGLDYYNGLAFECIHRELGLAVLAGGRYDALSNVLLENVSERVGLCAVGWAAGMDRLVACTQSNNDVVPDEMQRLQGYCVGVAVIANNKSKRPEARVAVYADRVARHLREELKLNVRRVYDHRIGDAVKQLASYPDVYSVVIVGEEECDSDTVKIKNVLTKQQQQVQFKNIANCLAPKLFSFSLQKT